MALFCSSDDYKYAHEITINNKLISSKIKFCPPKPSYKIIHTSKDNSKVDYEILSSLPYKKNNIPDWINITLYSMYCEKIKSNVVFIHIKNNFQNQNLLKKEEEKGKNKKNKIILYSHENGKDLFLILPFLIDLSIQGKCNVISYEYIGYGRSLGKPTQKNFLIIYKIIMHITLNFFKYQLENILLMGRDIGALISLIIASRIKFNNCKGLILISPVISDKYIDINSMKKVICPTLLIQPKNINDNEDINENEVILFCREINNEKEWFPKDKNIYDNKSLFHNVDFLIKHRKKFISYIREFMKSNNEENNCISYSSKSTNTETSPDNLDKCLDDIEINNNNKIDIMKEFEEEDKINYNINDDY